MNKHDFMTEENRVADHRREHTSPSGRYRLVTDSYTTGKGTWNYTRGRVYKEGSEEPFQDVARNYGSFGFLWMEDHINGHDYLVCGEDYQGQTFIELDTGARRDHLPEEAKEGHAFCWVDYELLPDGKTLRVDGCYWACPYEFRFYDVSNPMGGWPLLEFKDGTRGLDADGKVTWEDGLIVWRSGHKVFKATGETETEIEIKQSDAYSAHYKMKETGGSEEETAALLRVYNDLFEQYPDDDEEEGKDAWDFLVDEVIKVRLETDHLVLLDHWKSEYFLERERKREEWAQKDRLQKRGWRDDNDLFVDLCRHLGGPDVPRGDIPEALGGCVGWLYPSQHDRIKGEPNPAFFRVSRRRYDPDLKSNYNATLLWGVLEGTVKVELWIRGKGDVEKPVFPATSEGIIAAWDRAGEHLDSEVL